MKSRVIVDQVVFDADNLNAVSLPDELPLPTHRDLVITTDDSNKVGPLSIAAFIDWIDFAFVPTMFENWERRF